MMFVNQKPDPVDVIDKLMCIDREALQETVFIHGRIVKPDAHHFEFEAIRGNGTLKIQLPQTAVKAERDSSDTALIQMTAGLANSLGLAEFVLNDTEVNDRLRKCEEHNAPYFRQETSQKPIKIGGMRI